jgi:hypothetical protein
MRFFTRDCFIFYCALAFRSASALLCVAIVLLVACQAEAQNISLEVLRNDGYGVVPLKRPRPNVLSVAATVNDRKLRLIVDTGWSADGITLEKGFMRTLGLPGELIKDSGTTASGAKISGIKTARAERVKMGNVELAQVPVYFAYMAGLRAQSARALGADGFVGAGFLRTCSAIIDLQNLRLYLRPPGHGRKVMLGAALRGVGLAEAPFIQSAKNTCAVEVEINGVPGVMILDTGAYHACVDPRLEPRLKTNSYRSRALGLDAAGVSTETRVSQLRSFKIGGSSIKAPDLRIQKFGFYDETKGKIIGLLGMDILGRNGTLIDFGEHKLYFLKNG